MHLIDLDIDIPYRNNNANYSKVHQIFRLKERSLFYRLRCQYSFLVLTAIVKKKNISYTRITFS